MRRLAGVMLSVIAGLSFSIGSFAGLGGTAFGAAAEEASQDVARMYRTGHELTFDLQGTAATLDGQAITPNKSIVKDGRVFVPLRLLGASGTASSIKWDGEKREARIAMKPQITSVHQEIVFRLGRDQLYASDGKPFSAEKIPAPFVTDGLTYIPVKALSWLGISASLAKGLMTWTWNNDTVELLGLGVGTDQETLTFNVLYQREMALPRLQASPGEGGWTSAVARVTGSNIVRDGRIYERMGFNVKLSPGINRIRLSAASGESAEISALRIVPSGTAPVPMTEAGRRYLKLEAPTSGYLTVLDGEKLRIAGTVAEDSADMVRVDIQRFQFVDRAAGSLTTEYWNGKQVAIRNRAFESEVALDRGPGFYLIKLESPRLPPPGTEMTKYAEIMVEVKPNDTPQAGSGESYMGYTNADDPNYANAVKQGEMLPPLLSDGWLSEDLLERIHGISFVSGSDTGMFALPTDYYLMLDGEPSRMLLHLDFPEGWRSMSVFIATNPEYGASVLMMRYKENVYFSIDSLSQAGAIPEEASKP